MTDDEKAKKKTLKEKGKQLFFDGNYEEAIKVYNEILSSDDSAHRIYGLRCTALSKLGRYDEALADAEKVISLKGSNFRGYLLKAGVLFYQGKVTEAIEQYEVVLKKNPDESVMKVVEQTLEKIKQFKRRQSAQGVQEDEEMDEKEVIIRQNGHLSRRRVAVKRHAEQVDRTAKYKEHRAATVVQSVWRGHMTRKWLQEIEKDADKLAKESENGGVFEPRPIVEFWENVIEPQETPPQEPKKKVNRKPKEKNPEVEELHKRLDNLEHITEAQRGKIRSLESTIRTLRSKKQAVLTTAIKNTPRDKPKTPEVVRKINSSKSFKRSPTQTGRKEIPNHRTLRRLNQIALIYRSTMKVPDPDNDTRRNSRYGWDVEREPKPFQF